MSSGKHTNRPERMLEQESEAARDLLLVLSDDREDEQLASDMIEAETSLIEALEIAIVEVRECKVIEAGCASAIETLTARKSRATHRRETIRAAIERALMVSGMETIRLPTDTLSLTYRKGTAIVTDEASIPSKFFEPQPPKLDKKRLTEALKVEQVPGAHLGNGSVSLTIRSK